MIKDDDMPLRRRKNMRDTCLNADVMGSLWIAVHMMYCLNYLSAEVNEIRGRASIWGLLVTDAM